MKITGPGSVGGPAAAGKGGARPSGGTFSLGSVGSAASAGAASATGGVAGVSSVDALLALQEVGGPLERKRRAVRRAGRILDVLDEVKIALLDGNLSPTALERLARAVREQRDQVDDPKLTGLLNDIETRAAVELAKLKVAAEASLAS